jgi:hypothetical protein
LFGASRAEDRQFSLTTSSAAVRVRYDRFLFHVHSVEETATTSSKSRTSHDDGTGSLSFDEG